jgi:hypothetical protein
MSNVPAGANVIRSLPPNGFRTTGALVRKVNVPGGLTTAGHSFLATRNGVVTGQVFFDWNGNGKREADDEGEDIITVFLDANKNGKLDKNEPRTTTDAQGNFRLIAPAGSYTLRQRSSAALYKQTLPAKRQGITVQLAAGEASKNHLFGVQMIPQ